jgi:hypothetical protein
LSIRYITKNNGNYYIIYFILLIVGIFAGMVEFIDITTNASAIGEIPYAICTPSTPGGCSGDDYCSSSAHDRGMC